MDEQRNKYKNTKTTTFLLPMLGIPMKKLKQSGFINAYLGDVAIMEMGHETEYVGKCLYLLFQPEDQSSLGLLVNEFDSIILNEYDYPEGYVVIVCEFPSRWNTDFETFIKGKYSELSKGFMSNIPIIPTEEEMNKFGCSNKSYAHMVHLKDSHIREGLEMMLDVKIDKNSEVASVPDMNYEILRISNFLEKELSPSC